MPKTKRLTPSGNCHKNNDHDTGNQSVIALQITDFQRSWSEHLELFKWIYQWNCLFCFRGHQLGVSSIVQWCIKKDPNTNLQKLSWVSLRVRRLEHFINVSIVQSFWLIAGKAQASLILLMIAALPSGVSVPGQVFMQAQWHGSQGQLHGVSLVTPVLFLLWQVIMLWKMSILTY